MAFDVRPAATTTAAAANIRRQVRACAACPPPAAHLHSTMAALNTDYRYGESNRKGCMVCHLQGPFAAPQAGGGADSSSCRDPSALQLIP